MLLLLAGSTAFGQTASFTKSPAAGCNPTTVSFTNTTTGTATGYSWNLGNGNSSTLQDPSATYTTPGTYYITLTATGSSGSSTYTDSVVIYDKPSVSFSGTGVAGCAPITSAFTASVTANAPGGITYSWDFGDGNTSSGIASGTSIATTHTYTTAGTYTVTLYITNSAGCNTTAVQNAYVTVFAIPTPAFSAAQTLYCAVPASVSFTNASSGAVPLSSSWLYGDGTNGTGTNPTHSYTASGMYNVTLTVTSVNGCSASLTLANYISVQGSSPTFTYSGTPSCKNVPITFVNTTPGAAGASWDFGDGSTSTGATASHAYAASGTYTVTITVTIGGCVKTATQTITINPSPAVTISQSPSVPCPKPSSVTFTANSSLATSYAWTFGNGQTANTQTATAGYNANGLYTVQVVATSAAGCKDSVRSDTVLVRDIIVAVSPSGIPDPYEGCVPLTIDFDVSLLTTNPPDPFGPKGAPVPYPFGAISWKWDFGDGSAVSTAAAPSHTYTAVGVYAVRCIITTPNGCTDTGFTYIRADTPVRPSFYATPLVSCPRSPVTFINTTRPTPNTRYVWFLGDTTIGMPDTSRVRRLYPLPDTYNIFLVSNHGGCIDTFKRFGYITVNPANAAFRDSVFCNPALTVKFINKSISPTSQLWSFGDGTTDTGFSPTHVYPDTGVYTVRLVSYNSTYGCTDTMYRALPLSKNRLDFTITRTTLCTGEFAFVNGTWTGNGTPYYSYIFGSYQTGFDSTSSANFNQFVNPGYYDVTMIVRSGPGFVCVDSLKKSKLVLVSRPIVNFSAAPPIGCQPFTTTFTDSSTNTPGVPNVSRFWHFGQGPGDTLRTTATTATRTYPIRGTYGIFLKVTDSLGCADSGVRQVYIDVRKPTAKFGVSKDTVCAAEVISFTDSSSGANTRLAHFWSFGDGTTATTDSAKHSYATPGVYTVRLIVTDSIGCMDTATYVRSIVVRAPKASFTQSDSVAICPPLLIRFTNTSTGAAPLTHRWDFGTGGSPVIVTSPVTTYSAAGLYRPFLVVTDKFGCTDTARGVVRVLGYNGAFTYTPQLGCAPMQVQFTATVTNIPRITWDFADGATLVTNNAATASHTYTTPGAYVPKVIFSDGASCSSSSIGLDTIKVDKLTAHFRYDPVCVGSPAKLYDSSYALFNAPNYVKWTFGPGDTALGSPVTRTYTTPGPKTVTVTVRNASGCEVSKTRADVIIHDLPRVNAGPDSTGVCPGDTAVLAATGAQTYVWSPAADLSCTACDTTNAYRTPSIYYVTGTDANGCVNRDSIRTVIQIKTSSSVGAGGEICAGDTFRLFAEGAQRYSWSPAEFLDSPNIASPLARPVATTTFIVAAQKGTCLIDSQRVTVVVHPIPFFSAGQDAIIALGSVATLDPTRGAFQSIVWRRDTTLNTSDPFRPTARPFYTTTYFATATDDHGCVASDTVTVTVRCNGGLTFIPNTFTPNGDGQNDVFYPRGEGIRRMASFRIFNRWGETVFERMGAVPNDPATGWDGTFKGQALAPDTYFYAISSFCDDGTAVSFKGDITLVR